MEFLPLILRVVLLSLSFFGLCAAARTALKLNRFIAPSFAACSVICILMFGGMLNVLKPAFWLLYFGGFAGAIYAYLIQRSRPDWILIGLFAVFAGYLAWRLGPTYLHEWDDLSHWGLVARHLLTYDAFPDAAAATVTFQAYPLGTAAFIYYVGKTLCNTEGVYLVAQNLLYGVMFLPVLAHIKGNRNYLYPAAALLFLIMFRFNHDINHLFVDWLLSFTGIATAASILYYKDDLKKALITAIPGVMAIVLLKSSGLFFIAAAAVLLLWCAHRSDMKFSRLFGILLLVVIAGAGAYMAWTMHVKAAFPAGMSSKHAVNLSSYAKNLGNKSLITILRIVKRMLVALIKPYFFQAFCAVFMAGSFALIHFSARRRPALAAARKDASRGLWCAVALYAFWHLMVFFTYVFSMSKSEALRLASYWRYTTTGLLYMMGLSAIFLFDFFSSADVRPGKSVKYVFAGVTALCIAVSPLLATDEFEAVDIMDYYPHFVTRETEPNVLRKGTMEAKEEYNLPDDGHYLIYAGGDVIVNAVNAYYRAVKYDLNSLDIHTISRIVETGGTVQETPEYSIGYPAPRETCENPVPFLTEHLSEYDAFLVLFKDEIFEAHISEFIESYAGATPVIFIYE